MIEDFRAYSEPAFAIVKSPVHLLQLGREHLLHLLRRHTSRDGTFRGFSASGHISEIHHQQSRKAVFQRRPRGQWSTLFQAFRQSAAGVHVGKEKMFQYLRNAPFSRGSLGQIASAGSPQCIFEFMSQTFKIGIHGVG